MAITYTAPPYASRHRRARVGQTIWWPSLVQDYVAETTRMFAAVDGDVRDAAAAGKLTRQALANWDKFHASWITFASNASNWHGGTADTAERYRNGLKKWQARLATKGSDQQAMPVPDEPTSTASSMFAGANVGIFVGIALALYLASRR